MTWVAHLVRTMTGQVGARLEMVEGGSWSVPINGIEDFDVIVSKDQLRGMEPNWWEHMRASVVVSWQDDDGSLTAWVAGPIVEPPSGESRSTVRLLCRGLGAIFEGRVVLNGEFRSMSALAKSRVRLTGMSLGTIAQEIVKLCTDGKTAGQLPIRYGSPRETGSSLNERTYEGFNLANNNLWKRLTELTKVRNGPDIAFRPEWVDGGIRWVMVHGTDAQPQIAQTWVMDVDTTAAVSPVADVQVHTDASGTTQRVYWTGAGEDQGTLIRVVQDVSALRDHMPLRETVGSTSDSDSPGVLVDHARAVLNAGQGYVTQISVRLDGSDSRSQIGRWRVGDAARLTMSDEWLTVPAGTTTKRIIGASGDWSSGMVDIEFQDDAPREYMNVEEFQ